jgi:hypothetical protein
MQVTALLHDLGKNLYLWGCDEEGTGQNAQFALVGDTFVVGCRLPEGCVYPEFNSLNSDMSDPRYNTELGIYQEGCGLEVRERHFIYCSSPFAFSEPYAGLGARRVHVPGAEESSFVHSAAGGAVDDPLSFVLPLARSRRGEIEDGVKCVCF